MRFVRWAVVITAILAAAAALVYWLDSTLPNSTKGVTVVAGNTARVPQGEDFILTYATNCGKGCTVTHVWHITYDGEQTVNFNEEGFLWFSGDHEVGTLCGEGCTTKVHMELWTDMYVTQHRIDGMNVVDVKWPWGWDYRPYRS